MSKEFSKIRAPRDKQTREGDIDRNRHKGIFADSLQDIFQLIIIINMVQNIEN